MFAQLQESFDEGVGGLVQSHQVNTSTVNDLREEIDSLKHTIASLEGKLDSLIANGGIGGAGGGGAMAAAATPVDPFALLQSGHVSEALECVLEVKDTAALVALLDAMEGGVETMTAHCSELVLLCTVQQLAADLVEQV